MELCVGGIDYPEMFFVSAIDSLGMNDWQTTDIEVRIKDTSDSSGLIGQTGTITNVTVSIELHLFSFLILKRTST